MIEAKPFIDCEGNMHLHAREGGLASFNFQDEFGAPRNMTSASVYFEAPNFRRQLTPGGNPSQLILTIQRGDLNQFLNTRVDYLIIDESGSVPHIIIRGKLTVFGWA